ncbi:MAG: carbohydrate ABC transporter permease [Oscillospiraceae bacterium]|nr:carbohydrate ABC transporter permease [Oscillospiraceae bacterium]
MAKNKTKIRESSSDIALEIFTTVLLILVVAVIGYPLIVIISSSFSSSKALTAGRVLFWPVDFSLAGYKFVFQFKKVWIGYRNTIFYTVTGVSLTMFLQILMAYPLSKSDYQGKGVILKLMLVAMMTSAGLIPTFLLKMSLGLVGNVWAVILAGVVGIRNVFMLRNAFKHSIPGELFDAAKIDGANDFQCLVSLAVPLAKATISVLVLYSAVGCWNDYFNAMIYLSTREDLWPLQLVLRNILTAAESISPEDLSPSLTQAMEDSGIAQIRFCLIIVATVPVLFMYTVVQKYFEKGVMIGSVKG